MDELLNRADIRVDPTDGFLQEGVPLQLRIGVVDAASGAAVAGAPVDVWHCNADGDYSNIAQNGTLGQRFLRGCLLTDANGIVEFTTIYPGWYRGRAPHIHVSIRRDALAFTAQLFFDAAVTAEVYRRPPYAARGTPDTINADDAIYRRDLQLALSETAGGYVGHFAAALQMP